MAASNVVYLFFFLTNPPNHHLTYNLFGLPSSWTYWNASPVNSHRHYVARNRIFIKLKCVT